MTWLLEYSLAPHFRIVIRWLCELHYSATHDPTYIKAPDEINIYLKCLQKKSWSETDANGKKHPYSIATTENIGKMAKRTRDLIKAGTNGEEITRENVDQVARSTAAALGKVAISRSESSLWFGRPLKEHREPTLHKVRKGLAL